MEADEELETSHDLVRAREARVRDILRIIGSGEADDEVDDEVPEAGQHRVLDHRNARGTWSAWDS